VSAPGGCGAWVLSRESSDYFLPPGAIGRSVRGSVFAGVKVSPDASSKLPTRICFLCCFLCGQRRANETKYLQITPGVPKASNGSGLIIKMPKWSCRTLRSRSTDGGSAPRRGSRPKCRRGDGSSPGQCYFGVLTHVGGGRETARC
jgi:hypothetical protein